MDAIAQRLHTAVSRLLQDDPEVGECFNAGASDADFAALEALIGASLPEDFKSLYRSYNGQTDEAGYLFDAEEWLSLERIADEWQIWKDLYDDGTFAENGEDQGSEPDDPAIEVVWWSPMWIPFTYDGSGNHLCVDLAPTESGTVGQVVRMWHDDSERSLEAKSFGAWIEQYVTALEAGEYVYSEEYGSIINVEDLEALAEDDDEDDED